MEVLFLVGQQRTSRSGGAPPLREPTRLRLRGLNADELRTNSKLKSLEYSALELIFLRFADRFAAADRKLSKKNGQGRRRLIRRTDYLARCI